MQKPCAWIPRKSRRGQTLRLRKRIRGCDGGREIRMFKDQLTSLSNALIRLAMAQANHLTQINTHVVSGFDLWYPKDNRRRVLWWRG